MDVTQLKQHLFENPDDIVRLLEHYGYEKINQSAKEIRCARDSVGNSSSIRIKVNENLTATDFAKNISGDIISLFMSHRGLSFVEVLSDIKDLLNLSEIKTRRVVLPFGGMFSSVSHSQVRTSELKTYDESILSSYDKCWNEMFLRDGITPRVQKLFNIGYDEVTKRITVPWRSTDGKICGVMGRYNSLQVPENTFKWFPVIPFPKIDVLYGFSENYIHLLESDDIFIGESEKFTLQLASFGYRNSVSLGGNNLSESQIKHILSTNPKRIILCFDEGLDMEVIARDVDNIKPFIAMKEIQVFMVMDFHNKYLEKDGKQSPSDLGKKVFEGLIDECLVRVL